MELMHQQPRADLSCGLEVKLAQGKRYMPECKCWPVPAATVQPLLGPQD
jgi:hypothetical protein